MGEGTGLLPLPPTRQGTRMLPLPYAGEGWGEGMNAKATLVRRANEALLDKVKAGDKVRFTAEKAGGAIVVTNIQPAK